MQVSATARFLIAMTFMAVVLGISLWQSGADFVVGAGMWLFVVIVFGVYLYFRMVRSQRNREDDRGSDQDL